MERTRYLVRRARLLMGMTQAEFAKEFAVDPGIVSLWELGSLQPRDDVWNHLRQIALHTCGPLAEDVLRHSPLYKYFARMDNLRDAVTVSKGLDR